MSGNPIMTFPIKKRINTERLLIENRNFIYTRDQELIGEPLRER